MPVVFLCKVFIFLTSGFVPKHHMYNVFKDTLKGAEQQSLCTMVNEMAWVFQLNMQSCTANRFFLNPGRCRKVWLLLSGTSVRQIFPCSSRILLSTSLGTGYTERSQKKYFNVILNITRSYLYNAFYGTLSLMFILDCSTARCNE